MKTLSEYYTQKGQRLPSVSERAPTYEQYGLGKAGEYVGSAEQNIAFLNKLMAGGPAAAPAAPAAPAAAPTPVSPAYPGATMPKGELYRYQGKPEVYERIGEQVFHIPSPAAFETKYGAGGWGQVAERGGDYTDAINRLVEMGMPPGEASAMAAYQRMGLEPEHEKYIQPLSEQLPEELRKAREEAGVDKAKTAVETTQGELTTLDEKIRDIEDKMARAKQAITTSPYLTTSMISGKVAATRREYGIQLNNLAKQRQTKTNELNMAMSNVSRAEAAGWKGFEAASQFLRQGMAEEAGREEMPYWKQHLEYQIAADEKEFEQKLAIASAKQGGTSGTRDEVGYSNIAGKLGVVGMTAADAQKVRADYETSMTQGLASIEAGDITEEMFVSGMSEMFPGMGKDIRGVIEEKSGGQGYMIGGIWVPGAPPEPEPSFDWKKLLPWGTKEEKEAEQGWLRNVLPW